MTTLGTCRLCGEHGPLRESHILPKFSYERVLDRAATGQTAPTLIKGGIAMNTNRQIKERMLCPKCEVRFSVWEDVVARLVHQEDGSFPWPDALTADSLLPTYFHAPEDGADAIERFAVSVVWRAHNSKDVPNVSLGPYEATFRDYLLTDGAPFPEHVLFHIQIVQAGDIFAAQRMITTPTTMPYQGARIVWFALCGAVFTLIIGKSRPRNLEHACFARTRRIGPMAADLVMNVAERIVANSKAVGKLAKMKDMGSTP